MVWVSCATLKELLVALMLIGKVKGTGGGEVVSRSVETSVSSVPGELTCNAPEPAIPEAFVLSELTLSDPGFPVASAIGMAMPLAGSGLPLSLSSSAVAKLVFATTLADGSMLKRRE